MPVSEVGYLGRKRKMQLIHPIREFRHLRSVIVLMGSAGIGQIFGLISLPFITIFYRPSDLGIAQTIINILGLIGMICCGKMDQGILVVPTNKIGQFLTTGIFLSFVISIITGIILFTIQLFSQKLPIAYWIIVPAIFLIGFSQLITAIALRRRVFAEIARTKIIQSILSFVGTVGFGIITWGSVGLVLAHLINHIGGIISLWKRTASEFTIGIIWENRRLVQDALTSNGHLLWGASGSALINNIAWSVPILSVAYFYGTVEAGYFAFALKCVSPVRTFIISTLSQISIGEGSRLIETGDHAGLKQQVMSFFRISSIISFFVVCFGGIVAYYALYVLPEQWQGAVKYLIPFTVLVAMQLAINPLTCLPILYGRQKSQFFYDLVRAFLIISLFLTFGWLQIKITLLIIFYLLIMFFTYIVFYMFFYSLFNNTKK